MFFSYILIIAVSFSVYALFLIWQSARTARAQTERENELTLREIADKMDDTIGIAQDVVRDLRYSTVMRDLYMTARLGNTLDGYTDYAVQTELRSVLYSRGASLYGVTIFLDGNERVYSGGGVLYLDAPFVPSDRDMPLLTVGAIEDVFGFEDNRRYYFQKRGLLYCDSYTWQTGVQVGTCCIFIDAEQTERALAEFLGEGCGVRVSYRGEELLTVGAVDGTPIQTQNSGVDAEVRYELYGGAPLRIGHNFVLYGMLLILALIALFFVWLAYWESKRYYQPIGKLGDMVSQTGESERAAGFASQTDEMDGIIAGIEALIGEKNRYHEKMLTIGPYAGAGMLQAIVAGGEDGEKLSILTDEDFLDLKRPYFIVSVVNFASEGGMPAPGERRAHLDDIFRQVSETWSTEERRIAWYFRDASNVYLIVNYDALELADDLFYNLHRQLAAAVASDRLLVSMGVDRVREDIAELKDACEGAVAALDGVLHDGRGEIFFSEEETGARMDYYFPAGFGEQLKCALERRDREAVHGLLFDIYKKNLDLDVSAEVYRALIDECYPAVVKAAKEATGLVSVHLNIRRTQGLMTLQEIFDYYDAVLMSVIDLMIENEDQRDESEQLDAEILAYVDAHFCDQEISLQLLSDRFHVSNKYLLLLFKQRHGATYLQYLQNRRITRAAQMIREGAGSLAEIGELVGYPNQLTFRRNFKAVMGVNPSDYKG